MRCTGTCVGIELDTWRGAPELLESNVVLIESISCKNFSSSLLLRRSSRASSRVALIFSISVLRSS
jgi:hypothetical protein